MAFDFFGDAFGAVADFGSDIVGSVTGLFDKGSSLSSVGDGLFSIFDNNDIWGSVSSLAGDIILEGSRALATIEAAEAALNVGESAADVFFKNADILYDESLLVEGRTMDSIINARLRGTRLLSEQIVRYNKSGVTLEGSPLLVLEETQDLIEIEVNNIFEEGVNKSNRLKQLADIEEQKAQNAIDDAAFKSQAIAVEGITKVGSELLGLV